MKLNSDSLFLRMQQFVKNHAAACLLSAFVIGFALIDNSFFSVRNFRNILSDFVPLLLAASGIALCLSAGLINLSAGAAAGFAGIFAASLMQAADSPGRFFGSFPPLPAPIAIFFVLGIFFCIGLINGLLVNQLTLPSWLASLCMALMLYGLSYMYLYTNEGGMGILDGFSRQLLFLGTAYIGTGPTYSLPLSLIFSLAVFAALWIWTKSRQISPSPKKTVLLMCGMGAALFALSGIFKAARFGTADISLGQYLGIDALAACLIGGISLFGGKIKFSSVFVGALIYTATVYAADFAGLNRFVPLVLRGFILLATVSLDIRRNKASKASTLKNDAERSLKSSLF